MKKHSSSTLMIAMLRSYVSLLLCFILISLTPRILSATPPVQLIQTPGVITGVEGQNIVVQFAGKTRPRPSDQILVPSSYNRSQVQRVGIWVITHVKGQSIEAKPLRVIKPPVSGMQVVINSVPEPVQKRIQLTTYSDPRFGFLLHTLSPRMLPQEFSANITGLYVYSVHANLPAAKAGVRAGDILFAINDMPLGRMHASGFERISNNLPKKLPVKLKLFRNGKIIEVELKLDNP